MTDLISHDQDVVLAHAGSGALLLSVEVLCDPGSSILVPSPGFSLYKCLSQARGVEVRMYRLLVSHWLLLLHTCPALPQHFLDIPGILGYLGFSRDVSSDGDYYSAWIPELAHGYTGGILSLEPGVGLC